MLGIACGCSRMSFKSTNIFNTDSNKELDRRKKRGY